MNKEIKYAGYSAQPSDYECQDGQQSGMLNLIPEDGSLRPIFPPKPILKCNLGGVVRLIHHVPNQDNYIIVRQSDNGQALYWLLKTDVYSDESGATFIDTYNDIRDIAIVGNTLALATGDGLRYLLWKEGAYVPLSSRPPFVPISFGMRQVGTCDNSADLTVTTHRGSDGVRPDASQENTNAVMALLLPDVNARIVAKDYFYMPFFVRYAFSLYDGSYNWHSAPVLMLPMVIPPIIGVTGPATPISGDEIASFPSKLNVPYFSLDYKILDDGSASELADWKDLVTGIDVFVSAPIYTYDQSKTIRKLGYSDELFLSAYYDWEGRKSGGYEVRSDDSPNHPSRIFAGHYSALGSGSEYNFVDHFVSNDSKSKFSCWLLAINEKFHDQIKSVSQFYKVASIPVDKVSAMESFDRLPIEDGSLAALVSRPTLPDDFGSHRELSPSYILSFNSRLNLADVRVRPAKPFPLKSAVEANTSSQPEQMVTITVYSKLNGVLCKAVNNMSADPSFWDMEDGFPRYIYYPDSSAYKMVFEFGIRKIVIDLTPHDFLNGAYWYGLLGESAKPASNADDETRTVFDSVSMGNKIYTSEINNPFSFPVNGINTIGSGQILGISTAAKALSQGQFGQFPLYAFTTEGVWALEVGSNGFYIARQPITRDVCTNAKGITQIDSAVLFPSARGVMLLSGSNSTCISDVIGTQTPFALSGLPSMSAIAESAGCTPNQYGYSPFGDFLKNCRMIYDYLHQRIIVCGESSVAYVFSLKSKEWGMMANVVESVLDSYPEALAMSKDGHLVDFSQKYVGWQYPEDSLFPVVPSIQFGTNLKDLTGCTVRLPALSPLRAGSVSRPSSQSNSVMRSDGFFVTRPLKLDMPDVLKTIDTIIQRGIFRSGHVRSVLYGSRDLVNWHLVWSSKDHYLRGFRGSPYKYFRIACITSLSEDESIFGASVQFTPKLLNQPR